MIKSNAMAETPGDQNRNRNTHTHTCETLTGEEGGLQEFVVELHDPTQIGCRIPGRFNHEHSSPENCPMGEAQADKRDHDILLPFPKRDAVQ